MEETKSSKQINNEQVGLLNSYIIIWFNF